MAIPPYQNSNDIMHGNRKTNLKVQVETQKFQVAKTILSKIFNAGGTTYSTSKYTTEP
jgi:hypothetical protein